MNSMTLSSYSRSHIPSDFPLDLDILRFAVILTLNLCDIHPQGARIGKSEFTISPQEALALWSNRLTPSLRFHRWFGTRSKRSCYHRTDSAGTSCRCGNIQQWKRRMIWRDTPRGSWAPHCPPTGRSYAVRQQMKHWDFGTCSRRERLECLLMADRGVLQRTGSRAIHCIWGYDEGHWIHKISHFDWLCGIRFFWLIQIFKTFNRFETCSQRAGMWQ